MAKKIKQEKLSPIVLFVYNRPEHTRKTLESISNNILARSSKLIVYADGPKAHASELDIENIKQVRQIVKNKRWCKELELHESLVNKGLACSIVSGVTRVVNQYGKVIVLEDDVVISKYFLEFMNQGLLKYAKEDAIIGIHAYVYPVEEKLPETFFLKDPGCWGWATWKRSWKLFENDSNKLFKAIRKKNLESIFDYKDSYPFTKILEDQFRGTNDSWAIRWKATCLLKNKLILYPGISLAKNIGNDNSGTHSGKMDCFDTSLSDRKITINDISIEENAKTFEIYKKYFIKIFNKKSLKLTLVKLIKNINNYISFILSLYSNTQIAKVNHFSLKYTDKKSIWYEYKDIFINEIYKFKESVNEPIIIDGGGCIGMSVIYFKEKYPNSKITVFEPDPHMYKILTDNLANNSISGVIAKNEGLGKKMEEIAFYPDNSDGGSGKYFGLGKSNNATRVKINKLSKYIKGPVDLLKLNIEGMEGEVIQEIENKISMIKNIIIEYHCFSNTDQNLSNILDIFNNNGFKYVVTEASNAKIPRNPNMKNSYRYFNIIYASKI